MKGQVLKVYQSLAGSQSLAAPQTQQHLLRLVVNGNTDKATMVAAVESDPAIFAAVLSYKPPHLISLAQWHVRIDVSSLRALITLIVTQSISDVGRVPSKRQALLPVTANASGLMRSLLAERLAAYPSKQPHKQLETDVDIGANARLVGLLAGLAVAPEMLADMARGWGLAPHLVDALRFFRLSVPELADVSLLVKILALSEHMLADLVQAAGGRFPRVLTQEPVLAERSEVPDSEQSLAVDILSEKTLSASKSLLGLSTALMNVALREAIAAYELIMAQVESSPRISLATQSASQDSEQSDDVAIVSNTQQLVSEAAIGNALYRALIRQPGLLAFHEQLQANAQFLFGFSGVLHFIPEDDCLSARVSEQENLVLSVAQLDSVIATGFSQQRMSVVSTARVVIDLQVMDRLAAVALMIVPLGDTAGVLACGLPAGEGSQPAISTTLMMAFASAVSEAHAQQCLATTNSEQIPLEYLQQRVREVTHEVNNPLAIVQNYLHVLSLKLDEDAPVQADIVTIGEELARVASIVGKYGEIGQTADLLSQSADVNEILTQLVSVVQGGQVDITIELQLDPGMPQITVSPDSLKQVIINLVKNATEALRGLPIADKLLRIETTAAVNVGGKEYIEIAIIDNGPGIDPVIRQHLFLPENSTKTGGEGGLGLSIAKQLVDAMQGLISCRSKVSAEGSAGTCFQILIPRQRVLDD